MLEGDALMAGSIIPTKSRVVMAERPFSDGQLSEVKLTQMVAGAKASGALVSLVELSSTLGIALAPPPVSPTATSIATSAAPSLSAPASEWSA